MHLCPNGLVKYLCIVLIGFCCANIDSFASENVRYMSSEEDLNDGLVEVESQNLVYDEKTKSYLLFDYKDRRSDWGGTFGVSYSFFDPVNYQPNFIIDDYQTIYGSSESPLIELNLSIKYNFSMGSISPILGIGMYQNNSDDDIIDSDLKLIPIRLGVKLTLDALMQEPLFVPYFSGGTYTIFYEEKVSNSSFSGNTQPALYFAGGVMLQLNWIDKEGARISYQESGIENTYIYAEGRKTMASSAVEDPDFETDIHLNIGFMVEM